MQVSAIVGNPSVIGQRLASSVQRAQMVGDAHSGFLTSTDLKLLKTVTGWDFPWPPKEGEGAPMAAFDLAAFRERQMAAGSILKDLTSADLTKLKSTGQLVADFADKAAAYLDHTDTTPTRVIISSPRFPSTPDDGSLYL